MNILTENMDKLHQLAGYLYDHETITGPGIYVHSGGKSLKINPVSAPEHGSGAVFLCLGGILPKNGA